jgi:prepilin signal peptidase PulO-like enzyme (type II secretory pathway)
LVVEFIFGVSFTLLYHYILREQTTLLLSFTWLLYYTVLFSILGVMALYDMAHSYIPISFLFAYGFMTIFMMGLRLQDGSAPEVLLGPVIVALPFLLVWLITKGKGVGFGDILLFLGVGAFFGVTQGIVVLLISIWSGAITGLYLKYFGAYKGKKNIPMPFVPYIAIAFLVVLFTDIDIFSIASIFA